MAKKHQTELQKKIQAERQRIRLALAALDTKIDQVMDGAKAEPRNWGYLGDLQHIAARIENLVWPDGEGKPEQK